ncbi:3-hydroxybutyryl-CoA dehydrogenase [Bacillus ectoiniformans]|uniref:3-hydroxyacyl-CoA dehydrogenase family protein n=1 Tax=Bacillus ectoiniformans TaxID=1494429 RepID=UPI00195697BC|nr:3-hydroxyacyl-CoA dehydrogenase family protein [Bacillus ectoiniformans]MBM7647701.1 3-hydroxybutyryl-CoA dehydrogenase [Bacillus ectoiniformans]
MNIDEIKRITVIGAGQMGHQIAMLSALGGFQTVLYDVNQEFLVKAKEKLTAIMNKWVAKKKINQKAYDEAFSRLSFSQDLKEAVKDSDFIIEAVTEKLEVKRDVFAKLDQLAPAHAILASNSSTIVNSLIASATNRPEQVVNMHFFFPPLVMDCVEVVKSDETSEETAQVTMDVCKKMNRTAVLLHKEISGFIANRILGALQKEAVYLYENGYADFADIDLIVKKALNHPIGPFELMDLSGIDVGYYVMQQQYEESGNPADKPPRCMEEKMNAGQLGRKTGQGFYTYEKDGVKA